MLQMFIPNNKKNMKKNKEELKTYFETGDKPTQEQYADLIDSFIDAKQPVGEANRSFSVDENGEVSIVSEKVIPEYTLSDITNNKLSLLKDGVAVKEIDLTSYIDDTNLSRLVSGEVDENGIATFKRDDDSIFKVDLSELLVSKIKIFNGVGLEELSTDKLQFDNFHKINTDKKEIQLNTQYFQLKTLTYLDDNLSGILETKFSEVGENINTLSLYNLGYVFRNPAIKDDFKIIFNLKNQYRAIFERPFTKVGTVNPNKITIKGYLKPVNCKVAWSTQIDKILFFEQTFNGQLLQKSFPVENTIIGKRSSSIGGVQSNYITMNHKIYDSKGNIISVSQNKNYQVRTLSNEPILLEDCQFYLIYSVDVVYDDDANVNGENMNFTTKVANDFLTMEIIK